MSRARVVKGLGEVASAFSSVVSSGAIRPRRQRRRRLRRDADNEGEGGRRQGEGVKATDGNEGMSRRGSVRGKKEREKER